MNKAVAGVIASLLGSLIWYLASPAPAPGSDDPAALRTPVRVTLTSGEVMTGELQGSDSLCADWTSALQGNPATRVTLPDGRTLDGQDVRSVAAGRSPVAGALAMGAVSACGDTLTIRQAGAPSAGGVTLQNLGTQTQQMKDALKDLTPP